MLSFGMDSRPCFMLSMQEIKDKTVVLPAVPVKLAKNNKTGISFGSIWKTSPNQPCCKMPKTCQARPDCTKDGKPKE